MISGVSVISDDAHHIIGVDRIGVEGSELMGQFCAGQITDTGCDTGDDGGQCASAWGVVGQSHAHDDGAEVSESESERSEIEAFLSDLWARVLRHGDGDIERDGVESDGGFKFFDIESAVIFEEFDEVDRSEVASGIVEEHEFRAWVTGADGS